ncbi:hypothetical protein L798_10872 [Zootermopsis nevadensis]|uniref:Uncharacterized protein n=1 Tax=Zootermopsis nevadensis TaxID=136037 RepID=A0A067QYA1_ZOONE|nr:hypothetical protein L798_10872 [Zootermopsis nevadensis]
MLTGTFIYHTCSLQKMRTAALMKRFRDRTLERTESPQNRDWATIGLAEVFPTISVLTLGVLVSVLVLALECSIGGLQTRRNVDVATLGAPSPVIVKQFDKVLLKDSAMMVNKKPGGRDRRSWSFQNSHLT